MHLSIIISCTIFADECPICVAMNAGFSPADNIQQAKKGFTKEEFANIMKQDDKHNDELICGKRRFVNKKK